MNKSYYYRIRYRLVRPDGEMDGGVYVKQFIQATECKDTFATSFHEWLRQWRGKHYDIVVLGVVSVLKLKQWEVPDFASAKQVTIPHQYRRGQK